MTAKTYKNQAWIVLAASLFIGLTPWLVIQASQSITGDKAWLATCAMRVLDGWRMSDACYDTNPPLSILVYILPAAFSKYAHIPIYAGVFAQSLCLVALSAMAVGAILRRTQWLAPDQTTLLVATYILANTLAPTQHLGEREHLIALGLFPFVLLQMAITKNLKIPARLKWPVLILGSISILIKPHFGLIPSVIFLHRAISQKRLSVVTDQDFLTLSVVTVFYLAAVFVFFHDFISVILPDILMIYISEREPWIMPVSAVLATSMAAAAAVSWLLFSQPQRFVAALMLIASLCVIPFAVQGKGFYYHLLPAIIFFLVGLALLIDATIAAGLQHVKELKNRNGLSCLVTLLCMIGLVYGFAPPNAAYATHDDYSHSEVATLINSCGDNCSFYIFNDMNEMTHQLAVYTGKTYASRFPSLWFLPVILKAEYKNNHGQPSNLTTAQIKFLTNKYKTMLTEDLKRYDPGILLIGRFHVIPENPGLFDFAGFFGESNPEFKALWQNYEPAGTIDIDRSLLFGGTLYRKGDRTTYDVYRKRHNR